MKTKPILLCLMMVTVSFAGCLGGNGTVVTDEGDPVTPGELPDDWPTYYVATANDLPTCDTNTLGRLYYVEADVNFQACMSTGWQVVTLGGGGTTPSLTINQPPRITAQIMALDDDVHNLTPNGWYYVAMAHWSAADPEGETVTIGIDADRDGTIDLNLNTAEGASIVELPWNSSIQVSQIEMEGERFLHLFRIFDVIAEDASGASSTISVISSAMQDQLLRDLYDSDDASDNDFGILFPTVPQSDIDWVTASNAANPTCGPNDGYVHNTFSAEDALSFVSNAPDDNLIVISWTCADFDINWADTQIIIEVDGGLSFGCGPTSNPSDCLIEQTGDNDGIWAIDETIYLKENGADICESSCQIDITITHNGQVLSGTTTVMVDPVP